MRFRKVKATPNCLVYTAKSVPDFLDCLLPGRRHWKSAKRGDLAYRGQAASAWPLLPKAFRDGVVIGYDPDAPSGPPSRVVSQARAEFLAVHDFVRAADSAGLQTTETGAQLLLQDDPSKIFNDPKWEYSWPQNVIVETLALAQHHGVPTRLLDFTEDPLVAAYFAASSAWNSQKRRRIWGIGEFLAVWVIDLRFVRSINKVRGRYTERIGEVRVPRANNSYLHAQYGFFLIDRGANDVMTRGGSLSLDQIVADRALFWQTGKRLAGKGIRSTWFDNLPVRQIRLRISNVEGLLRELEDSGVTRGSVMPSLDRVVESLELQRSVQ